MQYPTVLLTILAATGAIAAPAIAERDVSMAAAAPQWTIKSMTRKCNKADTACNYKFGIDTHVSPVASCDYTVKADSKASRAPANGVACGPFTVSSGWSGQFGEGNGFTTWAVTDQKLIAYPAYTDKQLADGKTVSPDQSYPPLELPH